MSARLQLVKKNESEAKRESLNVGLAEWLLRTARAWHAGARGERKKHMRVVETLTLGTKNKLVLVSCGGERFLVGAGGESIGTIVRVRGESAGLIAVKEQV